MLKLVSNWLDTRGRLLLETNKKNTHRHDTVYDAVLAQYEVKITVQYIHTAKTQYRKFKTNIPRKRIARLQSQFPHSCFCEWFIYSHHLSAYSAVGKYVNRSWEYINRSQTHECGNWGRGCAIPFLGIHKWGFSCGAVYPLTDISFSFSTQAKSHVFQRSFLFSFFRKLQFS